MIAEVDSPPRDVSAMDGYAVRDADLARFPARLAVVAQSLPGATPDFTIGPGRCARIFTGAPVPPGADRVVIQEVVRREGDAAIIDAPPGNARHIRARGSDFAQGDELLPAGRRLDPRALVAAAGADLAEVEVWRRPRVTILVTGDELAPPGEARTTPGAIPESVSFGVAALVAEWGGDVIGGRRLADDLDSLLCTGADALAASDLVVVTGGASVGERDFAKRMFGDALELIFTKVAIKPGKPVWLARAGAALVIGLPGNPTSALVTARLLLAPLLAGLAGRDPLAASRWHHAPLAAPLPAGGDRETFLRARWDGDAVAILSFQDSGAQKALAEAELLVRQRANASAMAAGEMIEVLEL